MRSLPGGTGSVTTPAVEETVIPPSVAAPRRIELWLPVAVVALDQLTKALVRSLVPLGSSVEVVPGLMNFTHVRNTGAAFGFLNAADFPLKTIVIPAIGLGAIVWVAVYAAGLARSQWFARLGLALIMGGAAGNLLDRVIVGSVVDFVDVYWRTYHFWAFNVADSAISVGVAIMILDMLGVRAHVSKTV
jgi:signal peptidase II